ncbi:uncharacterized protein EI90DRAFT_2337341 [Cantharellus anzutake]|uniref:uncharacterized protein n=1 Tax=Cantharellus anzutake TaxID=1750568 RepID=UPI00190487AC|nr:uncharacterized protein EI90DRAFT_2337341 [Cantharellus anzutake]KAF8324472.1 hypothetical protein EI90DRAFT_2337341 [Cantharellus anzutake]
MTSAYMHAVFFTPTLHPRDDQHSNLYLPMLEVMSWVVLGLVIASIILGVTSVQMVRYYRKFPNDAPLYRSSVAVLCTLQVGHIIIAAMQVHHSLVDEYGDSSMMSTPECDWLGQVNFARCITQLSATFVVPCLVILLVAVQSAFGIAAIQVNFRNLDDLQLHSWIFISWSTATTLTEVVSAFALLLLLSKRWTGVKSTDKALNKLICLAAGNGAITAVHMWFAGEPARQVLLEQDT